MTLDGLLDIDFGGTDFEVEFGIESVQLEEVTMRLAGRRAGAAVPNFVEVVIALARVVGELLPVGNVFRKFVGVEREVIEDPVDPGARGSVRIVHDEGEGLRIGGSAGPGELGRDVGAVAGEFLWDGLTRSEGAAGELEGHSGSRGVSEVSGAGHA